MEANQHLEPSPRASLSPAPGSLRSGGCAAVFAGDGGHISEATATLLPLENLPPKLTLPLQVLYIDIKTDSTKMVSAGMDSSIRVLTPTLTTTPTPTLTP